MNSLPIPTVAELKKTFAAHGVRPNRGLGQNFLVDANAMRYIVRTAQLGANDVVLEPGAGTGGLTGLLAARAAKVVAAELDRKLYTIAAERLSALPNVTLIHCDIMGSGDTIAQEMLDALRAALSSVPDARFKVVANLPYRISTALIAALLVGEPTPAEVLVTVQDEVAERICASPGSADYGYLSVLLQALAQAKRLKRLSPKVFWPQPEVDGCVLRIRPDRQLRAAAGDLETLRRVASALFGHRRKQAAGLLVKAGLAGTCAEAVGLLSAIGAAENVRAEELEVRQFVALARDVRKA